MQLVSKDLCPALNLSNIRPYDLILQFCITHIQVLVNRYEEEASAKSCFRHCFELCEEACWSSLKEEKPFFGRNE